MSRYAIKSKVLEGKYWDAETNCQSKREARKIAKARDDEREADEHAILVARHDLDR